MSVTIYYFSGTGNSYIVARDLAELLGGKLLPMATEVKKEAVEPKTDAVGIVFPVYYGDLPLIVRRFVQKVSCIHGAHIFAVSTYGGGRGESHLRVKKLLHERGLELAAGYSVHMPQNAFKKSWEKPQKLFEKWGRKRVSIASAVEERKQGLFVLDIFVHLLTFPIYMLLKPLYKGSFARLVNKTPDCPIEELIPLMDTTFYTNEHCNGCGICAKVCPVDNITMVGDKPEWHHHCENCIACYNFCPQQAIETDIAQYHYYYRHPDVSLSDIQKQKSGDQ
jgi:ferredoxin